MHGRQMCIKREREKERERQKVEIVSRLPHEIHFSHSHTINHMLRGVLGITYRTVSCFHCKQCSDIGSVEHNLCNELLAIVGRYLLNGGKCVAILGLLTLLCFRFVLFRQELDVDQREEPYNRCDMVLAPA